MGKRRKADRGKNQSKTLIAMGPTLPRHLVLDKDATLKEKAKEMAGDTEQLNIEFSRLEEFVKETVIKESTVARLQGNKTHNRYKDIGEK